MASAEFRDDLEEKRPNVQVGDPFKEKLLLEACLEAMEKDLIIGIQDMGAAGLTCSTSEMASNSGTGIEIDLDLVPQREAGMTPYEIMLSESQERMLLVASKDKVEEVQKIFTKWDLDAVVIGKVTSDGRLKVNFHGERVVDIPVDPIVNLCPAYHRESKTPAYIQSKSKLPLLPEPKDYNQVLDALLAVENLAEKEWVYRQYDHMVQINTVVLPGADASVLRIKNTKKALAVSLDGNSLYTYLEPKTGSQIAVAECCRNLACVGAYPLGVTNCLNFGNPEKPEIMWQFKEVVEGMSQACRAFNIPVTGGNVSFYNETDGAAIYPTPVLGIVGMVEDVFKTTTPGFKQPGDIIILLGENKDEIGASLYLKYIHNLESGPVPQIDLKKELAVQEACRLAIEEELLESAHDVSEGGLAVCLMECCLLSQEQIGCNIEFLDDLASHALLFSETQSRIVVTAKPAKVKHIEDIAKTKKIKISVIGETGGKKFVVHHHGKEVINYSVDEGFKTWKKSIPIKFTFK